MKVFGVSVNTEEYQIILPTSKGDLVYELIDFSGFAKENTWKPLEFHIYNPLQKRGNFFSIGNGSAIACDLEAIKKLSIFFTFGGELLPISLEDGTELFIFNVTTCINALDQNKTKFDYYNDGTKGRVLDFVFHDNRFSESSIFKIPETAKIQILTYTGVKSEVDEFYSAYQESGLKGLKFKLLYSNE